MPRGHEHSPFSIYERLSGIFSLSFLRIRLSWEKDRCAVFGNLVRRVLS